MSEFTNIFKRNLTLLDLQMVHSVAFNMTSDFSFQSEYSQTREARSPDRCRLFSCGHVHAWPGSPVSLCWSVVI